MKTPVVYNEDDVNREARKGTPQQVKVCQRIGEAMGAEGYVVFDAIENDELVSYVFANQYDSWKASFKVQS